ncbi:carboxylesterase family protein [uncultured Corynebacterium sp.]|uniref:carboxylesterase family protein n=1 Tax=uncultured Corynebacterium sp. TaxID=159447 RepID=UPI0025DC7C45|nr:carboxylesterase family protein [uncultured Corynebacterium sp.]
MSEARVESRYGTFLGTQEDGITYFHSIPYSHIPGPFETAEPLSQQGTVDARTPRPEDIALTVIAPADAPAAGLPVIVYVHGGRYEHGSHEDPRAEGTASARRGVVTVQIDYRVTLPGFAKFDDDDYFFYRGIDDVQLGLEWVQRCIEAFGGDPTNVTLVGQSAGATTALWLARRDHYKGAFRRVVALSPCYPRTGYEHRKATLRQAMGVKLDRATLSELSEERLSAGYAAFAKKYGLDIALGPYPLAPAELADVPIVVTSTREEFYNIPTAERLDATPLRRAVAWFLAPKFGLRREKVGTWADLSGAAQRPLGRLIGDSTIRQWVTRIAAEAPGPTWMMELVRTDVPSLHSKDIRFFFGNAPGAPTQLHDWLLRFATRGEVGFPEYGEDHAVFEYTLDTGQSRVTHGALDYVAQAFAED